MVKRNTRKRQAERAQEKQKQQQLVVIGALVVGLVVFGFLIFQSNSGNTSVTFPDIHGMSFTGDGDQLRVATHTGIVAYRNNQWSKPDLPSNDYMGYSGTEDGFFSSGHPGIGSDLINPIGLVRSADHGATITTINFSGESDFHVMSASYYGEAVYVLNPTPNSLLPVGLHYSLDAGQTWEQASATGLTSPPIQIAVHPTDDAMIAAATRGGLFVSNDYGATFEQIGSAETISAVAFDPNGDRILFGFNTLLAYHIETGDVTRLPQAPAVDTDQAILYLAINPINDQLAASTSDRDIFYSPDNGDSWNQIASDGQSL